MSKDPREDLELREFLKTEFVNIAEILRLKEGLNVKQIRQLMKEVLSVTI